MPIPKHLIAVANSVAASHEEYAPDDRVELLVTLANSLHKVGQPSHRLERTMTRASYQLDREMQIMSLPTGLIMAISESDGAHSLRLQRIDGAGIHLERLARLSTTADKIVRGMLDPGHGKVQIERIMDGPERWGPIAVVCAYVLSAGAFSVFFGGGAIELLTAIGVGLAVGLLSIATQSVNVSRRLFELSSALAAAWIASISHRLFGNFVEWIPLAAGLIILLPGMATLDAVEELANGQLASGGARLAGVVVVFLAMTFGAVLGLSTAALVPGQDVVVVVEPLPRWVIPIALLAVSAGSLVRFRARPTDFGSFVVASFLAFIASRAGAYWIGPIAGAFLASLLLGTVGNLAASWFRQPPELFDVPGLAILVPGSIGVRSLSSLVSQDTAVGVDAAFTMFVTAMAIVAGMLFSNSIVRRDDCVF